MPRYALLVEYDGAGFVGWQTQDNGLSIQTVIETAARRLTHDAPVIATAAGRTDAGVHAFGQVVHIDLPVAMSLFSLRDALNFHMKPHAVVVLRVVEVGSDWSARFSAVGRAYRYRILNRRARPALLRGHVWHVQHPLDVAGMAEAAAMLLGRHDFTSFRASSCQAKSPLRTLDTLRVTRDGETVEIVAEARSFLHHQVRNMVGTLKLVGEGSWPAVRVAEVLAARDRRLAGPTAPADGLVLTGVRYTPDPFT